MKGDYVNQHDLLNVIDILDVVLEHSTMLPLTAGQSFSVAASTLKGQAEGLTITDLNDPALQAAALQILQVVVGIVISLDFFNLDYPEGEEYLDQTFKDGGNTIKSKPTVPVASVDSSPTTATTEQPAVSPPSSDMMKPSPNTPTGGSMETSAASFCKFPVIGFILCLIIECLPFVSWETRYICYKVQNDYHCATAVSIALSNMGLEHSNTNQNMHIYHNISKQTFSWLLKIAPPSLPQNKMSGLT